MLTNTGATRTENCGSWEATLAMARKLMTTTQRKWRRLCGYKLLADIIGGEKFKDGKRVEDPHGCHCRNGCTPDLSIAPAMSL